MPSPLVNTAGFLWLVADQINEVLRYLLVQGYSKKQVHVHGSPGKAQRPRTIFLWENVKLLNVL